ncbi:MAG: sigma-70 family RNA polymerase sigma factor [Planctomycetota bacterium]
MNDSDFREFQEKMRRIIRGRYRRLSSRFRTSDVLQEGAIQMIKSGDMEKKPHENMSWLRKIALGHGRNLFRFHTADKRTVNKEDDHEVERLLEHGSPDELVAQQELASRLMLCLTKLTPEQRQVIDLKVYSGVSFAEIAREMERSDSWVRRRYAEAIARLRVLLKEDN